MGQILDRLRAGLLKVASPGQWKRAWGRWLQMRQRVMDNVLSALYTTPMRVLPKGHVGMAAAAILWFWQDGVRQVILVRSNQNRDGRARLVSCFGLGAHPDAAHAMRASVEAQLGRVFYKTLDKKAFNLDRVAAAPMFTFSDETNGITSPVQVLAWVVPIEAVQLDLIQLAPGMELALTSEVVLNQAGATEMAVSPTHRNIWLSVKRHLPALKSARRPDGVEEVSMDALTGGKKAGVRTLH